MKETYKISVIIAILLFFLLSILQPLWKLQSLEIGNNTRFIKDTDNSVFLQIKNMTAGDCAQDTFIIKNNLEFPFNVKLQCEKITDDNECNFLLDQLNITIMCQGKEVYKGLLSKIDKLNDCYIDLGIYNGDEEKNLNIKIYLDNNVELNENEKNNKIKLRFTTNNEDNVILLYNKENQSKYLEIFPLVIKVQLCRIKKIKAVEDKLNLQEYLI